MLTRRARAAQKARARDFPITRSPLTWSRTRRVRLRRPASPGCCYFESMMLSRAAGLAAVLVLTACAADPKPTPEEARKFIDAAEQKLLVLGVDAARADWIKSTYIIDDSESVAAKLDERSIAATVDFAKQATR